MLSILQQEVFDKAKEVLKVENWYNGVCLYDFPTDEFSNCILGCS